VTLAISVGAAPVAHDPRALRGWSLYDRYCLACHGASGDGKGPAAPYASGDPRAFSEGAYEWRSTPVGQPPTDDDLRQTIRFGAAGTSMPGFEQTLSAAEIDQLIEIVRALSPAARPGKPIVLAAPPPRDAARGAELWKEKGCAACHGETGRGDGPSAKSMAEPPYDLTAFPLRRPRATDNADARRRAAALSIATGLAGTPMPGYAGAVSDPELWALADHVVALGGNVKPRDRSVLDEAKIVADRTSPILTGTWPGTDPAEAKVFGAPLRPQGTPPASLAPAQTSLSSQQCARCHAKQAREWQPSVHAKSAAWGLGARELDHATEDGACNRCHTPLAEQSDGPLRAEGVTCASCHVRDWVRHGPPNVSPLFRGSAASPSLLPSASYPLVTLSLYERADFCMPCHQLPPRTAVAGKPLLDTYREWLEGPYMARGVQCQHCHMPNREHTWLGVHDPETFRQGVRLDASAHRSGDSVSVVATLANVGAGHYLPTTPTPAFWLRIELLDRAGHPIAGARDELRIGRDIEYDSGWHEKSDTRIPPGESRTMARAWRAGRTAEAAAARITVEVHPDAYYEGLYAERLASKGLPAATRTAYEAALARAKAARYVAEQREVPIALSSKQ
jgi:mono/diheme cytochrome c family protein